eukprot:9108025-Ditylum_brightwellii.AAC.1
MCSADVCTLLVSRPVQRPSLSTFVLSRHATSTRTVEQCSQVWWPVLVAVVLRRSTVRIVSEICGWGKLS